MHLHGSGKVEHELVVMNVPFGVLRVYTLEKQ